MAVLKWILALPLIAVIVVFSIAHGQAIDFVWSPVSPPLSIPLYLLVVGGICVGFLLGCVFTWFGMARLRQQGRAPRRTIRALESRLHAAQDARAQIPFVTDAATPVFPRIGRKYHV